MGDRMYGLMTVCTCCAPRKARKVLILKFTRHTIRYIRVACRLYFKIYAINDSRHLAIWKTVHTAWRPFRIIELSKFTRHTIRDTRFTHCIAWPPGMRMYDMKTVCCAPRKVLISKFTRHSNRDTPFTECTERRIYSPHKLITRSQNIIVYVTRDTRHVFWKAYIRSARIS